MKQTVAAVVMVVVVMGMVGPASAEAIDSFFDIWLVGNNEIESSTGNGYMNGEIFLYPQTGWWNQWFFNEPEIFDRWKVIDYVITVDDPSAPVGGGDILEVVVNWSTPLWPDPAVPPIPGMLPPGLPEEDFIVREAVIWNGPVDIGKTLEGTIIIDQYNPVWVSIDVRATPLTGLSTFNIAGHIYHECLPEPATLGLLAVGGLALLRKRR